MIWRIFRRGRPAAEQHELDHLRNAAVLAWIRTVPQQDRLAAFLETVEPSYRRPVERSARSLFDAHNRLLNQSPPATLEAYLPTVEKRLRERFPWMSSDSFQALASYSHWMNWHG